LQPSQIFYPSFFPVEFCVKPGINPGSELRARLRQAPLKFLLRFPALFTLSQRQLSDASWSCPVTLSKTSSISRAEASKSDAEAFDGEAY